eukprot:SAG31_NODE_10537_length_1127_cov_1.215953_1_plen_235_part_00
MVARSPASCLAVLREVNARGEFSSLVLAVTVVKDCMVLVLFSVNIEIVVALLPTADAGVQHESLQTSSVSTAGRENANYAGASATGVLVVALGGPVLRLGGAAVAGVIGGASLVHILRLCRTGALITAALFFWTGGLSLAADAAGIEGLLVCLISGAFACNRPGAAGEQSRRAIHVSLDVLVPANAVWFFTLVGATLQVPVLLDAAAGAALLAAVRLVAIYCSGQIGGLLKEAR